MDNDTQHSQFDDACSFSALTLPARSLLSETLPRLSPSASAHTLQVRLRTLLGATRSVRRLADERGYESITVLARSIEAQLRALLRGDEAADAAALENLAEAVSKLAQDPSSQQSRSVEDPAIRDILKRRPVASEASEFVPLAPVGTFLRTVAGHLSAIDIEGMAGEIGRALEVGNPQRLPLAHYYWDLFVGVLGALLGRSQEETILLPIEERLLIDYGLLDEALGQMPVDVLVEHAIAVRQPRESGTRLMLLTDFLAKKNTDLLKLERKESIRRIIDATQNELAALRERLAHLRRIRDNLQDSALHNDKLAAIDRKMQQIYWYLLEIQYESGKGHVTDRDRRRIAQYKTRIAELRESKGMLLMDLTKVGANQAIIDTDNEIYDLLSVFMKLGYDLYGLLDILYEDDQTRAQYLSGARMADMLEEVRRLRSVCDMIARQAGSTQSPALAAGGVPVPPDHVAQAWDRIGRHDRALFKGPLAVRKGAPSLVLFPGTGNGMYDWFSHSIFVPMIPVKDIRFSLLTAAAEWRMDSDEDKSMQKGYLAAGRLPSNTSILAYRQNFTNDYVSWMLLNQESAGSLNRQMDVWFSALTGQD